jgi:hypothetical protein
MYFLDVCMIVLAYEHSRYRLVWISGSMSRCTNITSTAYQSMVVVAPAACTQCRASDACVRLHVAS